MMSDPTPPHAPEQQSVPKVFDVMRPGRAPASSTSRPVIVGHTSQVHDPMTNRGAPSPLMQSLRRVKITPVETTSPATTINLSGDSLGQPPLHVVEDAAKALHVPDEPLLLAHNADAADPIAVELASQVNSALQTPLNSINAAATLPQTTTSAVPPTPEIEADAKTDLAALAVEGVTEIEDSPPEMPPSLDTNMSEVETSATPPVAVSTEKMPPVTEEDLPDMSELGHEVEAEIDTQTSHGKIVVSKSSHRTLYICLLWFLLLLIIAAAVFDLLLDGGFIVLKNVPHTHFF